MRRRREMDGSESFEGKTAHLTTFIRDQQAKAAKLDAAIANNLKELRYGE